MNDLVVQNVVVIPVVLRHAVFATANSIRGFDFSLFSATAVAAPVLERRCTNRGGQKTLRPWTLAGHCLSRGSRSQ
jgi:hypothetical protein